jgi:hypothetical protein
MHFQVVKVTFSSALVNIKGFPNIASRSSFRLLARGYFMEKKNIFLQLIILEMLSAASLLGSALWFTCLERCIAG